MAKRRTTSSTDRQPLEFEGTLVEAGHFGHIEVPVARLPTGTRLHLPVIAIHGVRPGPTIWLSAAVHGDELNGIAIIRELGFRIDAMELAGTILSVPVVNPFGLIDGSRYLPDRRDLNRSFPGSRRGSLAAQLANLVMERVIQRCTFGIDFHTGSQGRTNLPQIRIAPDEPLLRDIAETFAPPAILYSATLGGSLRHAAARRGIPSLLYEAGEDTRFNRRAVQLGVEGTLRVLKKMDMIEEAPPPNDTPPFIAHRSSWLRASRAGLCRLNVSLGDRVERGDRVAVIFDVIGRHDRAVRARTSGVVIGRLNHAVVHRGEAIAHIAEPSN